jgi:hypothetical protein
MDYFIIFITTAAGLYFHWWLFRRIRRWMDRDLALSLAGDDPDKRSYLLRTWGKPRLKASSAATCPPGCNRPPRTTAPTEPGSTTAPVPRRALAILGGAGQRLGQADRPGARLKAAAIPTSCGRA